MTRLELLKQTLATPDPAIKPLRVIYAAPSSKVQLYSSRSTPLALAVEQWKRRFAA